ncbi:MAG: hypothetical protein WBA41_06615 [Rivularia sp. (in: cyanobacteria)]
MTDTIDIEWHQVQGNPALVSLHPAMLTQDGYTLQKTVKIKGESKKLGIPANVLYNKEYVCKYISDKVIRPLGVATYNELQVLIGQVWNEYKKENK